MCVFYELCTTQYSDRLADGLKVRANKNVDGKIITVGKKKFLGNDKFFR